MLKTFSKDHKEISPFCDLIGLHFSKCENGFSQCSLEVNEKLLNSNKVVHGGVIYSMADTGMGAALYTSLNEDEICATVELKINYLKPVREGILTCDTEVIQRGKSIAVFESEIRNGDLLIAKALGTFSIFKNKDK